MFGLLRKDRDRELAEIRSAIGDLQGSIATIVSLFPNKDTRRLDWLEANKADLAEHYDGLWYATTTEHCYARAKNPRDAIDLAMKGIEDAP